MKKHLLKSLLALALVLITGNAWGETATYSKATSISVGDKVVFVCEAQKKELTGS